VTPSCCQCVCFMSDWLTDSCSASAASVCLSVASDMAPCNPVGGYERFAGRDLQFRAQDGGANLEMPQPRRQHLMADVPLHPPCKRNRDAVGPRTASCSSNAACTPPRGGGRRGGRACLTMLAVPESRVPKPVATAKLEMSRQNIV
jgi:hypothetical protein